jgi:hypothetical protein
MVDSLVENFKMRFAFVSMLQIYLVRTFENPFSIEASVSAEKLPLELIQLQYDSILRGFNQEALITFYASLPVSRLSSVS